LGRKQGKQGSEAGAVRAGSDDLSVEVRIKEVGIDPEMRNKWRLVCASGAVEKEGPGETREGEEGRRSGRKVWWEEGKCRIRKDECREGHARGTTTGWTRSSAGIIGVGEGMGMMRHRRWAWAVAATS